MKRQMHSHTINEANIVYLGVGKSHFDAVSKSLLIRDSATKVRTQWAVELRASIARVTTHFGSPEMTVFINPKQL